MSEKTLMLVSLGIVLIGVVICVTIILLKWFDCTYRNPESSSKLNLVGFIMMGIFEPAILLLLILLLLVAKVF